MISRSLYQILSVIYTQIIQRLARPQKTWDQCQISLSSDVINKLSKQNEMVQNASKAKVLLVTGKLGLRRDLLVRTLALNGWEGNRPTKSH